VIGLDGSYRHEYEYWIQPLDSWLHRDGSFYGNNEMRLRVLCKYESSDESSRCVVSSLHCLCALKAIIFHEHTALFVSVFSCLILVVIKQCMEDKSRRLLAALTRLGLFWRTTIHIWTSW